MSVNNLDWTDGRRELGWKCEINRIMNDKQFNTMNNFTNVSYLNLFVIVYITFETSFFLQFISILFVKIFCHKLSRNIVPQILSQISHNMNMFLVYR